MKAVIAIAIAICSTSACYALPTRALLGSGGGGGDTNVTGTYCGNNDNSVGPACTANGCGNFTYHDFVYLQLHQTTRVGVSGDAVFVMKIDGAVCECPATFSRFDGYYTVSDNGCFNRECPAMATIPINKDHPYRPFSATLTLDIAADAIPKITIDREVILNENPPCTDSGTCNASTSDRITLHKSDDCTKPM